jgi:hypothetical protein
LLETQGEILCKPFGKETGTDRAMANLARSLAAQMYRIYRDIFVLSFSTASDSLAMWSNYSKNEGYNVEFKSKQLLNSLASQSVKLKQNSVVQVAKNDIPQIRYSYGSVIYSNDEHRKIIAAYLGWLFEKYLDMKKDGISNEHFDEFFRRVADDLISFSFICKKEAFIEEQEYRIVYVVRQKGEKRSVFENFRTRDGVFIPYIKLGL